MSCQTTYPEVYQSDAVRSAFYKDPIMPEPPKEPVKPTVLPDPTKDDANNGCLVIGLVGVAITFIALASSGTIEMNGETIWMGIVVTIVAIFAVIIAVGSVNNRQDKIKEYNESKATYNSRLAQYDTDYANYQKALSEYNDRINYLKSDKYLTEFRKNTIKEVLNNRKKPYYTVNDVNNDNAVKKGVSEHFFYDAIKNGINGNFELFDNAVVPVGETYYYPDILFVGYGLVVDIEIDEPYAGNDGTPIHYIKKERYSEDSIDYKRNDYLTEEGFEIIRFAEEQVFLNPKKCVTYIINFINNILAGKTELPNVDDFAVNKWTYEESAKLAYQRFRNTYVPAEYLPMIDKEVQRSYADFDRNLGDE